eukprot:5706793-Pyramimonas_sp.AAC.1
MAETVRGAGGDIAFLTPCAVQAGIAEVGFPEQTAPAKRRKTVEQRPDGTNYTNTERPADDRSAPPQGRPERRTPATEKSLFLDGLDALSGKGL